MKHKNIEIATDILDEMDLLINNAEKIKVNDRTKMVHSQVKRVNKKMNSFKRKSKRKTLKGVDQVPTNVPFCCTVELPEPFMLSQDNPSGQKQILFDISNLAKVTNQADKTFTDSLGNELEVSVLEFRIVGTIEFQCAAFPVVANPNFTVLGKTITGVLSECANPVNETSDTWIGAACCVHVDVLIKEILCCDASACEEFPEYNLEDIAVIDFAVEANDCANLNPMCLCGEQSKNVVKFRGCFEFPDLTT